MRGGGQVAICIRELTWNLMLEERPKGRDRAEPRGYVWEEQSGQKEQGIQRP